MKTILTGRPGVPGNPGSPGGPYNNKEIVANNKAITNCASLLPITIGLITRKLFHRAVFKIPFTEK